METWFRHCDPAYAFLWESDLQPPGRWHAEGEGPVQYLADTPEGAWAEFLRHEELVEPDDVADVRRALWAVLVPGQDVDSAAGVGRLRRRELFCDEDGYPVCQARARAVRRRGAAALLAPSAALLPGTAGGQLTRGGVRDAQRADGRVLVLFGARPDIVGHLAAAGGRLPEELVRLVRYMRRLRPAENSAENSAEAGSPT